MTFLSTCFPSSSKSAVNEGSVAKCIFCAPNLTPTSPHFRIVHYDERFIAFHDRAPAAVVHLLAVPRQHVQSIKDLSGQEGAELVRSLHAFGQKALEIDQATRSTTASEAVAPTEATTLTPSNDDVYGFHIPPLNSVSHLHLHCQRLPYVSRWRALEYRQSGTTQRKGWSWFVTAAQATAILESGARVRISPCGKL